ncbi:AAA family ATPase [Aphanothece hegewaldii CCALA 016]|uniref:AAA family ATPase n=2 Tax=Aphanothece TaxID=1121 RepID=A0A2T1LRT5_9CHRO|nr:AAA family ATPase [Aphanothece hegewaldii CCALA 016]
MMAIIGFPETILEQPIQERLDYFINYTMAHPHLTMAYQEVMQAVTQAPGTALIFVVGSTGVGKTTLLNRLVQKCTEAALVQMEVDKGKIPIFGVEAKSPEFSQFDWKDFYIRLLKAVNEPLIDKKITYEHEKANKRDSRSTWRLSVESALINRRPDAFYIDEAHHLALLPSGQKLKDQPEVIKSLANLAKVKIIPTGTYALLPLVDLGDQLCRRSKTVHFKRYHADSDDELEIFQSVVATFQAHLPLSKMPDLVRYWEFLYERSLGCVGMLKDWLSETLSDVLHNHDGSTITLRDLQRHARPVAQCLKILKVIKKGEEKFVELQTELEELRKELGLYQKSYESELKNLQNQDSTTERAKGEIGKPKPHRYEIGGYENGQE